MKKLAVLVYLFTLGINAQEIVAKLNKDVFDDVDKIGSSFTKYSIDSNNEGFELQFQYNNTILVSSFSKVNGNHNYVLAADRNIPIPFHSSILSEKKKTYIFYDGYKIAQAKTTDLKGNVENSKFFDINMKKKRLLATFIHDNKFYLLTNPRKTETLNLQIIDQDLNLTEKNIDLLNADYQHINEKGSNENIQADVSDNIIQKKTEFIFSDFTLTALETNQPNSIESITKNRKLYLTPNGFRITYQNDTEAITIIDVDLYTFTSSIKRIDKLEIPEVENKRMISNSYILNNHIFIVKGDKKKCQFSIYDLNKDEYIYKRFIEPTDMLFEEEDLLVDKEIWSNFNLTIPQTKNDLSVKKRLKNIIDGDNDIGLQVYDTGDLYYIKLGSHKLVPSGISPFDIQSPNLQHFADHNFIIENSLNFYLKKTDFSLTYNTKKSNSVKINEFLTNQFGKSIDIKTNWEIQFKHKEDFYLGYVHNKERIYYLRKFN